MDALIEKRDRRLNPIGNERLTAAVGLLLLAPILIEVATILLGVHTFMSVHVFVGLALIPPVLLKLGSTAWRFVRYYTRSRPYVTQGPPQLAMRLLAPLLVAATIILFSSGVAMGLLQGQGLQVARRLHGPAGRFQHRLRRRRVPLHGAPEPRVQIRGALGQAQEFQRRPHMDHRRNLLAHQILIQRRDPGQRRRQQQCRAHRRGPSHTWRLVQI